MTTTTLPYAIQQNQVTILTGVRIGELAHTPKILYKAGWTKIGITKPRHTVATSSITQQHATIEMHVTAESLFREIMVDPLLTRYNVIIIDDVHKREAYSDLLLGLLKLVMTHRKDLRIILSLVSLNADFFLAYFSDYHPQINTKLIKLDRDLFPVDIHYLRSPCGDYVYQTVCTILAIHEDEPPGDVLVFLTGREEIELAIMQINDRVSSLSSKRKSLNLLVLPLLKGFSLQDQRDVFAPTPPHYRKVVITTSIAESSLTLPDIVYVIDCGFMKVKYLNPETGLCSLRIVPTSLHNANQRAVRAGSIRPGYVYRLYPSTMLDQMPLNNDPELLHTSLLGPILQLQSMGIRHIGAFPFPSIPHPNQLAHALELLQLVGTVSNAGVITELGRMVAIMPLEPLLAIMLLKSLEFGCVREILAIVSMLSVDNVFSSANGRDPANFKQTDFAVEEGDHLTYLNVFFAYKQANQQSLWCHKHKVNYAALQNAAKIHSQLIQFLSKYNINSQLSCDGDSVVIRKCIVSVFFSQAAIAQPGDGSYKLLRDGSLAWIHPMSALFELHPTYIVYNSIVETNRIFLCQNTAVDHKWLKSASGSFYKYQSVLKQ